MNHRALGVFAAWSLLVGCAGKTSSTIDAGTDAGSCASASLTFVMHGAAGESFCVGAPDGQCTVEWLSITDSKGAPLTIDSPCMASCSDCVPIGCPAICAVPSPMPPNGVQRAWNGTYYTSGTCGAGTSCTSLACAAQGSYTATMCGYRQRSVDSGVPGCASDPSPTCATVTFAWPPAPGTTTIEATIDGG